MAVDRGALVLADLSGYTRYLTGVELEHSSDVIADLLGTIVAPLDAAGLRLAKLEGDCVFSAGAIDDVGLRTAIETTYCAFRARRRAIALATSCACDACSRIDDLDLKVVAHRGEWITHEVAGSRELTGPDVIVAHRLLKNDVDAGDAYALITGATGDHVEVVDGAEVRGTVVDLEACWQSFEARRPVLVPPADAVFELHTETAASPALVFEVHTAPDHQRRRRVGITA
jgi:class 3 adenylate cyclase